MDLYALVLPAFRFASAAWRRGLARGLTSSRVILFSQPPCSPWARVVRSRATRGLTAAACQALPIPPLVSGSRPKDQGAKALEAVEIVGEGR